MRNPHAAESMCSRAESQFWEPRIAAGGAHTHTQGSGGEQEAGSDSAGVALPLQEGSGVPRGNRKFSWTGKGPELCVHYVTFVRTKIALPVRPAGRKLGLKIRKMMEFILLSKVKHKQG